MLAVLAACETGGGDDGGGSNMIDAAAAVPVTALSSCPSTVNATVMDSATAFVPKDSAIKVGQVVKFVITADHFVLPNTLVNTDTMLNVSRGQTKCFRFDVAATYGFLCGAHGFTGTISVTP